MSSASCTSLISVLFSNRPFVYRFHSRKNAEIQGVCLKWLPQLLVLLTQKQMCAVKDMKEGFRKTQIVRFLSGSLSQGVKIEKRRPDLQSPVLQS